MDIELLEDLVDDADYFKSKILKNECPIIRKTLANRRAKELDKYRGNFSHADADWLLEVWDLFNLDKDFKKYFSSFDFYLKDFQKDVITNLVEKDNTLCIMPTGGGKSIIYWMSAMEIGGMTLVVSPLTALIAEQAEKLNEQGYEL